MIVSKNEIVYNLILEVKCKWVLASPYFASINKDVFDFVSMLINIISYNKNVAYVVHANTQSVYSLKQINLSK